MFRTFERLYVVSRLTSKIEMTSCHIINRLIYNKVILTVDILCTYISRHVYGPVHPCCLFVKIIIIIKNKKQKRFSFIKS